MRAEPGSCAMHFTGCLFIVPEGDDYTPFIKRESKKTTPPPPPAPSSAPQLSPARCLAPLQAVKEAVSMATGPPASWAGPSSCRAFPAHFQGTVCPVHHSAPGCSLGHPWEPPLLGGRGRNFKLKYSSKAPMWLVKPPKIIAVKQLLL